MFPDLQLPPADRTSMAPFGGVSGGHNPIYIDTDFPRRAVMPDVFAQGMLGTAWVGRLLTRWPAPSRLRYFNVRFQGITHLGNAVCCSGRVVEKPQVGNKRFVRIEVPSTNQFGQIKIACDAPVALV